jgi:hypothetical protein
MFSSSSETRNINKHHPVYGLPPKEKNFANNSMHLHNLCSKSLNNMKGRRTEAADEAGDERKRGWTEICVLRARSIKKHTPQDNHFIILMIPSFLCCRCCSISYSEKQPQ